MTTITINGITHRNACLDGLGENDAAAYDDEFEFFVKNLQEAAKAEGFELELDAHSQGRASYRITDGDGSYAAMAEYERAHDFMQSPVADFWGMY